MLRHSPSFNFCRPEASPVYITRTSQSRPGVREARAWRSHAKRASLDRSATP
ncbi:MAG: hypothetical protein JWN43_1917 [Gammaproteobacteria bacterium]|nr:hypothetical protein [Gammaproteobacteria bacterium]